MDGANQIAASIRTCLPEMSEDEVTQLAEFLYGHDFVTVEDLAFVQFDDIRDMLSLGRCRRLLSYWQRNSAGTAASSSVAASSSSCSAGTSSSSSTVPPSSSSAGSSRQGGSLHDQAKRLNSIKLPTFNEDSPFIPASVRAAIKNKQRATSKGREDMVQRIVDHCRETVPGFQRYMLTTVAKEFVIAYPDTFKDTLPLSDHSSDGLAKQMRDKLDNDTRVKNMLTANERQAPKCKEAFGCVMWNPVLEGEDTVESQEAKREKLLDMHRLSKKQWQWKAIKSNLEESFYLQRRDINGDLATAALSRSKSKKRKRQESEADVDDPVPNGMSIAEVKIRWPFLFTPKGMNYHFRKLTGQDFRDLLSKFSSETVMMIEYLACKGEEFAKLKRRLDRADRAGQVDAKLVGLFMMLILNFKESIDRIVAFVDDVTTFDEVPKESLPTSQTPILIAAGTSLFNASKYFFFIDNNAMATASDFPDALALLFSSYFTFNIEYLTEVASVLIFIQRVIAKNNAIGSKSKNFKGACEKVTKFYNKFQEYKQKVENEENELP